MTDDQPADLSEVDLDKVKAKQEDQPKAEPRSHSDRVHTDEDEDDEPYDARPDRDTGLVGPDGEPLSAVDIEDKAKRKEVVAQLLTRGVVNDRLDVKRHLGRDEYDPSLHYEWIRETDQDIERARSLGFQVVTSEEDDSEDRHGRSDNLIRLGDVILMACPKAHKEIIEEVKQEKKDKRRDAEKRDYLNKAEKGSERGAAAPAIDEGSRTEIRR